MTPGLDKNMLLDIASISGYIKRILPNAEIIKSVKPRPVAIAKAMKKIPALDIQNDHREPVENPCVMTWAVRTPSMVKTFGQVIVSVVGTHLAETLHP